MEEERRNSTEEDIEAEVNVEKSPLEELYSPFIPSPTWDAYKCVSTKNKASIYRLWGLETLMDALDHIVNENLIETHSEQAAAIALRIIRYGDGTHKKNAYIKINSYMDQLLSTKYKDRLVQSIFRYCCNVVCEDFTNVLMQKIDWNSDSNGLLKCVICNFCHKINKTIIVSSLNNYICTSTQFAGNFLIWLDLYLNQPDEKDALFMEFITKVLENLMWLLDRRQRNCLITTLETAQDKVSLTSKNEKIALWYNWFTKKQICQRFLELVRDNFYQICLTSPLVLVEIINELDQADLCEKYFFIRMKNLLSTILRNSHASVLLHYVFQPRVLKEHGYVVTCDPDIDLELETDTDWSGKNGHKNNNILKQSTKRLPITVRMHYVKEIRKRFIPHLVQFLQQNMTTIFNEEHICRLVSQLLLLRWDEDILGKLAQEVGAYLGSHNLFAEDNQTTFDEHGVFCLIKENLRYDNAVYRASSKSDRETKPFFTAAFAEALTSKQVRAYVQHVAGTKLTSLLLHSPIPKVASKIKDDLFLHVVELPKKEKPKRALKEEYTEYKKNRHHLPIDFGIEENEWRTFMD